MTIFDKNDPGSIIATVMLQAGGRLKESIPLLSL